MAAHRWIVAVAALALAACASRVEPRLDAGVAAGWQDGPRLGGNLGLGKYETTFAAPPLAGPVPPLSSDSPAPSSPAPLPAAVDGGQAGQDPCAGGACVIPGPTAAPASAPAGSGGDGGFPWVPVLLTAGLVGGVAVVARKGSVK